MATSRHRTKRRPRAWLRRVHRWLGIVSLFFILVLSTTGIALNHSDEWQLDQRTINTTWLLDAYGVSAPPPGPSFADDGHRATLLGQRLYLDGVEIARDIDALNGVVALSQFVMLASNDAAIIFTRDGQYVETVELVSAPEKIVRLGQVEQRPVVQTTLAAYIGDADLTHFEPASPIVLDGTVWVEMSPPPQQELQAMEQLYRGRGVSLERVLMDLHSGRILGISGKLLTDAVAAILILLSLTGLAVWLLPKSRQNRNNGKPQ